MSKEEIYIEAILRELYGNGPRRRYLKPLGLDELKKRLEKKGMTINEWLKKQTEEQKTQKKPLILKTRYCDYAQNAQGKYILSKTVVDLSNWLYKGIKTCWTEGSYEPSYEYEEKIRSSKKYMLILYYKKLIEQEIRKIDSELNKENHTLDHEIENFWKITEDNAISNSKVSKLTREDLIQTLKIISNFIKKAKPDDYPKHFCQLTRHAVTLKKCKIMLNRSKLLEEKDKLVKQLEDLEQKLLGLPEKYTMIRSEDWDKIQDKKVEKIAAINLEKYIRGLRLIFLDEAASLFSSSTVEMIIKKNEEIKIITNEASCKYDCKYDSTIYQQIIASEYVDLKKDFYFINHELIKPYDEQFLNIFYDVMSKIALVLEKKYSENAHSHVPFGIGRFNTPKGIYKDKLYIEEIKTYIAEAFKQMYKEMHNEEPQDEYEILGIKIKIKNLGFYFGILSRGMLYDDSAYKLISLNPFGVIQEYNRNNLEDRKDYPIYLKHIEKNLKKEK